MLTGEFPLLPKVQGETAPSSEALPQSACTYRRWTISSARHHQQKRWPSPRARTPRLTFREQGPGCRICRGDRAVIRGRPTCCSFRGVPKTEVSINLPHVPLLCPLNSVGLICLGDTPCAGLKRSCRGLKLLTQSKNGVGSPSQPGAKSPGEFHRPSPLHTPRRAEPPGLSLGTLGSHWVQGHLACLHPSPTHI